MNRISFTLPDVGLDEIKGMAYVDEGYLILSIQKEFLGMFERDDDTFKIEPGALEECRIERGWFRDKLILKPWDAELLDIVPGRHVTQLTLKVSRKQRHELEALVQSYETLF